MFVIVWLTTFFFVVPTILAISDEDNCKCPPNEELGQRSCNGFLFVFMRLQRRIAAQLAHESMHSARTMPDEETVNKMDGRK
uniref:Secreted protein n=1 Tax=Globodera rostochiensis TaxID=31243 RepID=A0A914IEB8_GLORO